MAENVQTLLERSAEYIHALWDAHPHGGGAAELGPALRSAGVLSQRTIDHDGHQPTSDLPGVPALTRPQLAVLCVAHAISAFAALHESTAGEDTDDARRAVLAGVIADDVRLRELTDRHASAAELARLCGYAGEVLTALWLDRDDRQTRTIAASVALGVAVCALALACAHQHAGEQL